MSQVTSKSSATLTLKPPPPVDDTSFQQFCQDYSRYFSFPELMQQQFGQVVSTIETMLVRLDELSAVTLTMSTTTRKMMETLLPTLREQAKFLTCAYSMIDRLENLIGTLQRNADELDLRLRKVEEEFSVISLGKIYHFFESIKSKSSELPNIEKPLQIIDTKEYFSKMKEEFKKN